MNPKSPSSTTTVHIANLKPPPAAVAASASASAPRFPPIKSQLYGNGRNIYRPPPKSRRRNRRSCCCCLFLWFVLFVIALLLLAAIASAAVWVWYRPQRPVFSIAAVKFSSSNGSSTGHSNSRFDLSILARNPNKKLIFFYDPSSVTFLSAETQVGTGFIDSFKSEPKNTTILKSSIPTNSDLRKNHSISLKIQLDTRVSFKMGGLQTRTIGIRILCDRVQLQIYKGKSISSPSSYSKSNCKEKLRIKIWNWLEEFVLL